MRETKRLVTPKLAAELLKNNSSNRPLSRARMLKYSEDMSSGRWRWNGDTIKIDDSGCLLDGQHRLQAVIHSGITIEALIVEGLPRAVFSTIDSLGVRGGGDVLGIMGVPNSNNVAASLHLIAAYRDGTIAIGGWPRLRNSQVEEEYKRLQQEAGVAQPMAAATKTAFAAGKIVRARSVVTALHYLFSRADSAKAEKFFAQLVDGVGLTKGEPTYLLRERLLLEQQKKGRLKEAEMVALFIKSWNAFYEGRLMRHLRWRSTGDSAESFPRIAGLD